MQTTYAPREASARHGNGGSGTADRLGNSRVPLLGFRTRDRRLCGKSPAKSQMGMLYRRRPSVSKMCWSANRILGLVENGRLRDRDRVHADRRRYSKALFRAPRDERSLLTDLVQLAVDDLVERNRRVNPFTRRVETYRPDERRESILLQQRNEFLGVCRVGSLHGIGNEHRGGVKGG